MSLLRTRNCELGWRRVGALSRKHRSSEKMASWTAVSRRGLSHMAPKFIRIKVKTSFVSNSLLKLIGSILKS